MKFAIVGGGGAMGGVWASRLAEAGHEVAILDVSPPALQAIETAGLAVEWADGRTTTTRLLATADPTEIGPAEAIVFFTKSYHTGAAAELARPLADGRSTIVSLQNGWGNADALAAVFPAERIVMGVTYHSATLRGPGRVFYSNATGPTFVGPYDEHAGMERAEAIAAAMAAAGIETTATADVKTEVWKKLILNCATLPTAALTGLTVGGLAEPGPMREMIDHVARETTSVANGLGYAIDPEERIAAIHGLLERGGAGKASMLQDVEARRQTEIAVINGAAVREADRIGIPTPLNRALVALIDGLERSWRR